MPATTQDLLEQILVLEIQLQEATAKGTNTSQLESQLFELREKLQYMNENLKNTSNVLKG